MIYNNREDYSYLKEKQRIERELWLKENQMYDFKEPCSLMDKIIGYSFIVGLLSLSLWCVGQSGKNVEEKQKEIAAIHQLSESNLVEKVELNQNKILLEKK